MAKGKRKVPDINSSSTADIAFVADLLLDYNINGYGPWFGKTFASTTRR